MSVKVPFFVPGGVALTTPSFSTTALSGSMSRKAISLQVPGGFNATGIPVATMAAFQPKLPCGDTFAQYTSLPWACSAISRTVGGVLVAATSFRNTYVRSMVIGRVFNTPLPMYSRLAVCPFPAISCSTFHLTATSIWVTSHVIVPYICPCINILSLMRSFNITQISHIESSPSSETLLNFVVRAAWSCSTRGINDR